MIRTSNSYAFVRMAVDALRRAEDSLTDHRSYALAQLERAEEYVRRAALEVRDEMVRVGEDPPRDPSTYHKILEQAEEYVHQEALKVLDEKVRAEEKLSAGKTE